MGLMHVVLASVVDLECSLAVWPGAIFPAPASATPHFAF